MAVICCWMGVEGFVVLSILAIQMNPSFTRRANRDHNMSKYLQYLQHRVIQLKTAR